MYITSKRNKFKLLEVLKVFPSNIQLHLTQLPLQIPKGTTGFLHRSQFINVGHSFPSMFVITKRGSLIPRTQYLIERDFLTLSTISNGVLMAVTMI